MVGKGHCDRSQNRKLTQEKKILPLFQPGIDLAIFQPQVWGSTTQLSLLLSDYSRPKAGESLDSQQRRCQ